MLNEAMMSGLEEIASTIITLEGIKSYSLTICECRVNCTDMCLGCADDGNNL